MNTTATFAFAGAFPDPVTAGTPLGNGYRWYLPALMRFNAPDSFSPFGAGGFNPYVYCKDDPINRIDPTGHFDFAALGDDLKQAVTDTSESTHDEPISVKRSSAAAQDAHAPRSEQPGHIEVRGKRTSAADPRDVWLTVTAQKKAAPVRFRVVKDMGVEVKSLEATLTAQPGNVILTDHEGRTWHVESNVFSARYRITGADTAVPIPIPVKAQQMRAKFRTYPEWLKGEALEGKVGDYLITDLVNPSNSWVVDNTAFKQTYDALVG